MQTLRETVRRILGLVVTPESCSACGGAKAPDRRMISGCGVYICEACVRNALAALPRQDGGAEATRCQFCGHERRLAPVPHARAAVAICGPCVHLADEILREDAEDSETAT